jgi:hypothetical protein
MTAHSVLSCTNVSVVKARFDNTSEFAIEIVYLSNYGEQITSDVSRSFFATNKVELV